MLTLNPEATTLDTLRQLWLGTAAELDAAAMQRVTASAAAVHEGGEDEDFIPFGDPYRFEIYPSLANLADGPLPVFNQATQWILTVKIWYDVCGPSLSLLICSYCR